VRRVRLSAESGGKTPRTGHSLGHPTGKPIPSQENRAGQADFKLMDRGSAAVN